MQAGSVEAIEKGIDHAAAALFALACGYAAYVWLSAGVARPVVAAEMAAAIALAYMLSQRTLNAIQPQLPRLPVPVFDVREVEPIDQTELLLTERIDPAPSPAADEALLLEDVLAELGPDSRVVHLFDPAAMPTAGELKSRIDRHLDGGASAARTSDAAQALHEALAELRRSIR
jgi:hypothetical protein